MLLSTSRLARLLTLTCVPACFANAQLVRADATTRNDVASQGHSVALSADGNTAIVGGYSDHWGVGAVWVWTRAGGVWTQQGSKLVAADAAPAFTTEGQGYAVALSADGNTALVGCPNNRAAWVWTRSGAVWTQQGGKLAGAGAVGGSGQGYSVALSADGNTAIVGGPFDDSGGSGWVGAAWVWTRSGGIWTQLGGKLVGAGAVGGAMQGWSVALSADGNTAIVGGYGDNYSTGAAWVWTRSGGVWSQQGNKLAGSRDARMGYSVALSADGNTAVTGGYASTAWVWTRSGGVWTWQGGALTGAGAVQRPSELDQGTSTALAADGNTAIVGGGGDNGTVGAAWVWARSGSVWTQQGSKLVGAGAVGKAGQGRSVALSGDGSTALVGGPNDDWKNTAAPVPSGMGNGAAWVWTRSGGVWTQQGAKLVGAGATDPETLPVLTAVVNAASFDLGNGLSPGEIVTIFGDRMGTGGLTTMQLNAGGTALATTLAGVSITFDGVPAPLLYVSPTQTSAVVPYGVARGIGVFTAVQAVVQGAASMPRWLLVQPTAPGVFTLNTSGTGEGAILNQDNSVNTASAPAAAGSVVQIFATGEGVTKPESTAGGLQLGSILPVPVAPVSVTIGGKPATVVYAGTAPGAFAGFLQVNAVIPSGLTAGPQPILLRIGTWFSQAKVTVAVK